ncbi:MAG: hypothetical protein QXV17_07445 [Candidatus Micrarchaeaceae archaeon]
MKIILICLLISLFGFSVFAITIYDGIGITAIQTVTPNIAPVINVGLSAQFANFYNIGLQIGGVYPLEYGYTTNTDENRFYLLFSAGAMTSNNSTFNLIAGTSNIPFGYTNSYLPVVGLSEIYYTNTSITGAYIETKLLFPIVSTKPFGFGLPVIIVTMGGTLNFKGGD